LVEQRIENPRVDGSIPSQATRIQPQEIARFLGLFLLRWVSLRYTLRQQ
jgi:hypothetical protein